MTEQEKKIYIQLYDKAYEEKKCRGKDYEARRYVFEKLLDLPPGEVDSHFLCDIPKQYFLETVYMILLKRWPENSVLEAWKVQREDLDTFEYEKAVLSTVVNSIEFQIKGMKLNDTIFLDSPKRYNAGNFKRKMYELYLKLPNRIQENVKKIVKK